MYNQLTARTRPLFWPQWWNSDESFRGVSWIPWHSSCAQHFGDRDLRPRSEQGISQCVGCYLCL